VQIGDPFAEKKLLECSLELLDSELLVSLQDLGAAGLTSSASEMASKGGVGLDIDCSRVPLREAGMAPFEIMVSESQERMLCVVEPSRVDEVIAVCARWETLATPIGLVTESGRMRILSEGDVVADLPVGVLVDDCPLYDLEPEPVTEPGRLYPPGPARLSGEATPAETLLALLGSANLASRRPVFEQYDPVVQSRTVRRPDDADAAVLMLPTGEAIAVAIDGNGRRVACEPQTGAAEAVYECAANLACVGATPLGLTNCLNFGNPEKPWVAWQLTEAVEGLASACEQLGVPVVGGNVSLYNEAPTGPIFPTPVIGMVGRLPDPARAGRLAFAAEGDAIALVGSLEGASRAGSELAKLRGEKIAGPLPLIDGGAAAQAHERVRLLVNSGAVGSAHDIAEGGIAVALAECCIAGQIGARVTLPAGLDPFAEAPGRAFVVSGPEAALTGLTIIGRVGGQALEIDGSANVPVSEMHAARARGLSRYL
jgi:phosphoribosylformylglycinamidine synthase